ncbi:MAG: hypothetical protein RMI93_02150 [Caldimicrobium sp.]|nr:hypothetical protein [Caldimicrobium sp.]MDW8182393.1 hypothetical protein [Caldimicrobium sp.]
MNLSVSPIFGIKRWVHKFEIFEFHNSFGREGRIKAFGICNLMDSYIKVKRHYDGL